jgi:hypothetical protein
MSSKAAMVTQTRSPPVARDRDVDQSVDQRREPQEDDAEQGDRKVSKAASTLTGLATHRMNSARHGKAPANSAKRQPIRFTCSGSLAATGGFGQ